MHTGHKVLDGGDSAGRRDRAADRRRPAEEDTPMEVAEPGPALAGNSTQAGRTVRTREEEAVPIADLDFQAEGDRGCAAAAY